MFLDVPGCSGMFRVPGFIDAPSDVHVTKMKVVFVTGSLTILTLKLFNSPMF